MKTKAPPKKRMTREQRLRQLLDTALQLIREEGTDALSLGRLAEAAGITKPIVYDHFGTRQGLLAALYQDFEQRHSQLLESAINACAPQLASLARVMAENYIGCMESEGREMPGILAALRGSPELAVLRSHCQRGFMQRCALALAPFAAPAVLSDAALCAMLGAADGLAEAAAGGVIPAAAAVDELHQVILAMVARHKPSNYSE